jgi:hypothetical protein
MCEDMCKMIDKVKNFKQFVNENYSPSNEILLYAIGKNDNIYAFNIPNNREELDKIIYNDEGKPNGKGYAPQRNGKQNIKFDSLEQIQKWYDDKNNKRTKKETENKLYQDLSNIAINLRKIPNIDYKHINRGSCFKFAKEVSKLGYKNFSFVFSDEEQEVIHVYIKLNDKLYFDAEGFHSKSDIKKDYKLNRGNELFDGNISELNNYCDIDTYGSLTTIPLNDKEWKIITSIIKKEKK